MASTKVTDPSGKGKGKAWDPYIVEGNGENDVNVEISDPSSKGKGKAADPYIIEGNGDDDAELEKSDGESESGDEYDSGDEDDEDDEDDDPEEPFEYSDDDRSDITESEAASSDHCSDSNDEEDPVVAEYDVFITEPHDRKKLYLFQWIGIPKGQPIPTPSEVRIKFDSGYVEVDVPIKKELLNSKNTDRIKAIQMGEALRKTKDLGQTAYGAAVGFERKLPKSTKRRGAVKDDEDGEAEVEAAAPIEDDNIDHYLSNFDDSTDKGHVLSTTTWSGRFLIQGDNEEGYMVGCRRGNGIHFTPLEAIIQLRPDIPHMDALSHVEANKAYRPSTEPKSSMVDDVQPEDDIADILRGPAKEPWEKFSWNSVDSDKAWASYGERMFLADDKRVMVNFESVKSYSQRILPRAIPKARKVQKVPEYLSETDPEEEQGPVGAGTEEVASDEPQIQQAVEPVAPEIQKAEEAKDPVESSAPRRRMGKFRESGWSANLASRAK